MGQAQATPWRTSGTVRRVTWTSREEADAMRGQCYMRPPTLGPESHNQRQRVEGRGGRPMGTKVCFGKIRKF